MIKANSVLTNLKICYKSLNLRSLTSTTINQKDRAYLYRQQQFQKYLRTDQAKAYKKDPIKDFLEKENLQEDDDQEQRKRTKTPKSTQEMLKENDRKLQEKYDIMNRNYFTEFKKNDDDNEHEKEDVRYNFNPIMAQEMASSFTSMNNNKGPNLILDLTFGLGGHSKKLLETYPNVKIVGLDIDLETSQKPAEDLVKKYPKRFFFQHGNFNDIEDIFHSLLKKPISKIFNIDPENLRPDGIIYDLGPNAMQYQHKTRGFSLLESGPLDMRYDRHSGLLEEQNLQEAVNFNQNIGDFRKVTQNRLLTQPTVGHYYTGQKISAIHVINFCDFEVLASIFRNYGDENNSMKLAAHVVNVRQYQPITSTFELSSMVANCLKDHNTGFDSVERTRKKNREAFHIARKVFNALRVYVNDEFNNLYKSLRQSENLLALNGRLCILNHLAMEDAIFKFATGKYQLGHPMDYFKFEYAMEELRKSQNNQKVWSKNKQLQLEGAMIERNDTPWKALKVSGSKGNHSYIVPTQKEVLENELARTAKLRCVEKVKEVGKLMDLDAMV